MYGENCLKIAITTRQKAAFKRARRASCAGAKGFFYKPVLDLCPALKPLVPSWLSLLPSFPAALLQVGALGDQVLLHLRS